MESFVYESSLNSSILTLSRPVFFPFIPTCIPAAFPVAIPLFIFTHIVNRSKVSRVALSMNQANRSVVFFPFQPRDGQASAGVASPMLQAAEGLRQRLRQFPCSWNAFTYRQDLTSIVLILIWREGMKSLCSVTDLATALLTFEEGSRHFLTRERVVILDLRPWPVLYRGV